MRIAAVLLLAALAGFAQSRQYLRQIKRDKNSGLTAPPVEPGTLLDDKLVQTLVETERQLLQQQGHLDPTVRPEIVPVSYATVDLHLHSDPGPRTVVEQVRFTGDPVLPAELERALRATRTHRVWHVFRLAHPAYAEAAVEADARLLTSFYYSRGYFDADVRPGGVQYAGGKAIVTFQARAGRHYETETPIAEMCSCLLRERGEAERQGRMDFAAELQIEPAVAPHVVAGEPFRVGRIEFTGNHHFGDRSIRRALVLEEGALFDRGRLRQSLLRINQLGFFEPLSAGSVRITRRAEEHTVDVSIALKERKRGRWSISGPVGPPSFAGDLEGNVSIRLPASSWFASATWVAFNPILKYLPFMPGNPLIPIGGLQRPLIAGQTWTSGFSISPQLGWQGILASYAVTHAVQGARLALGLNRAIAPDLAVAVQGRSGFLICRSPRPVLWWARQGAGIALDFATRSWAPAPAVLPAGAFH